jgi:hypothetical protein
MLEQEDEEEVQDDVETYWRLLQDESTDSPTSRETWWSTEFWEITDAPDENPNNNDSPTDAPVEETAQPTKTDPPVVDETDPPVVDETDPPTSAPVSTQQTSNPTLPLTTLNPTTMAPIIDDNVDNGYVVETEIPTSQPIQENPEDPMSPNDGLDFTESPTDTPTSTFVQGEDIVAGEGSGTTVTTSSNNNNMSSQTIIIIAASSAIVVLVIILLILFKLYCHRPSTKDNHKMTKQLEESKFASGGNDRWSVREDGQKLSTTGGTRGSSDYSSYVENTQISKRTQ